MSGYLDLLQLPSFLLVMTIFAVFMAIGSFVNGLRYRVLKERFVTAAFIAGASGGFVFVLVLGMIRAFARMNRPDLMTIFAIPGALAVVIASIVVEVAISGRSITEGEREWWGRLTARLAVASIYWMLGIGATLYLPAAFLAAGAAARLAIASGWLGSTALGVLTGRFVLPKLQAKGGGQLVAKVAGLAPPIFLIGLLGLVGLLASLLLNSPALNAPHGDDLTPFGYYLEGVRGTSVWMILLLAFGFGGLAFVGSKLIDVNLFSLNSMYANRLIRCYLGASRRMENWHKRWVEVPRDMTVNAVRAVGQSRCFGPVGARPEPGDRFRSRDDLPLSDLRIGGTGMGQREYWGPHLLVNTTLNLVAGTDLAWRSRKGESFLLSPLYCGAKGVGYVKLDGDNPRVRANLTLGRAISISGAAVDPNMSFYQSPALTALLAVFDARLGSWMQNPAHDEGEEKEAQEPASQREALDGREPEVRRPAGDRAVRRDRRHRRVCPPLRRRPLRKHGRVRADPPAVPLYRRARRGVRDRPVRPESCHPDPSLPDRLRHSHSDRLFAIAYSKGPTGSQRPTRSSAVFAMTTSTRANCRASWCTSRSR